MLQNVLCFPIEDKFTEEMQQALKPLNVDAILAAVDNLIKSMDKNVTTTISDTHIEILVKIGERKSNVSSLDVKIKN